MKPKYLAFVAISALLLAGCGNSTPQNPDQNIATQVVTQTPEQTTVTQVVTQTQTQTQTQLQTQAQTQNGLLSSITPTLQSVPPATQISTWDTYNYNDINWGFRVSYPKGYQTTGKNGNTIFSIAYPGTFTSGTNLHNANINVVAYKDDGKCLTSEYDGTKLTLKTLENGINFYTDNWQEGAAGNIGKNYGYATVYKGNCYKVGLVEYYANMNNYSDGKGGYVPGAPKPFEEKTVLSIFQQVFNTFKFTK
ncbi:MAG: hypothetical protein WC843_00190 [Candidatus Gracilibacteria bacterium]|jgi:hypothetical protein